MLIQITNCCHEGCRHCCQDSRPDGLHMTERVFKRAVDFGLFLKNQIYVISGGEPTEHPMFLDFCKYLNKILAKNDGVFTVCSNGNWFPEKKDIIEKLSRLSNFSGMQIYTNKQWYKSYDFIMSHKAEIESIPKVSVSNEHIYMQDLGRARNDEEAQKEVALNSYHMQCLNGHMLIKQIKYPTMMKGIVRMNLMCKPLVDFRGDVHLAESWLCPSFGNVANDMHMDIFNKMQDGKPCMKCAGAKRFLESVRPDIIQAKHLLGL